MRTINVKACAKINLCLDVVGKRVDGYHELEMIMVPLTLHDAVQIKVAKEDCYTCTDASLEMNESNTVVKAVELMRKTFHLTDHFHIHIIKNIPAQAGLAGGSADGAAVLRGIRELYRLPITISELSLLGKQIGADVPFCVYQTPAIVKGIGEIIEPFTMRCPFKILLVKPHIGISTPEAFKRLDRTACEHPNCEDVKKCLIENRFEDLAGFIANSLEYSACRMEPIIQDVKWVLKELGFTTVLMSGSGSTVFALSRDEALIDYAMSYFKRKDMFVCNTEIIDITR